MADAAPSIPAAIASLQTYSTALSAFTTAWRAVESHSAALDSTLAARLARFSELELICSAMDGAGLRAHSTGTSLRSPRAPSTPRSWWRPIRAFWSSPRPRVSAALRWRKPRATGILKFPVAFSSPCSTGCARLG
nr:unnamed protein product [Digitaria exilis]